MNKLLNPSDKEVRAVALGYIIFGLLICLFNVSILTTALRIIGAAAIIVGGYLLYTFFIERNSTNSGPLFIGVTGVLFGILMAFSPESILSILPVLVGLMLILNAITHLQKSLILKDYGYKNWTISLAVSLIILVTGVVLLFKPIQSLSFILQIMGISLIVEAIFMLVNQHTMKKYY